MTKPIHRRKKDKVSGSKENVKRVMTLMAIEQKMRAAIVADANVKVTDEEATQKHMQYVEFDYSTTSDSSSSSDTTVSEAEKKKTKRRQRHLPKVQRQQKILLRMQRNREQKPKMPRLIRIQ